MYKKIIGIFVVALLTVTFLPSLNGGEIKNVNLDAIQNRECTPGEFEFIVHIGEFSEVDDRIEGHISLGIVFGKIEGELQIFMIQDEPFNEHKYRFRFIIMRSKILIGLIVPFSPQINESFHTNVSAPYRYWRLELSKGTPIRVQGTLDELPGGEIPRVDFIFFDGNTNEEFSQLSEYNALSIDKTWTIPYDGIFFVGVECKYGFLDTTGTMIIYW